VVRRLPAEHDHVLHPGDRRLRVHADAQRRSHPRRALDRLRWPDLVHGGVRQQARPRVDDADDYDGAVDDFDFGALPDDVDDGAGGWSGGE
jgi:hypothetical protein